jgi:hypothetical protein
MSMYRGLAVGFLKLYGAATCLLATGGVTMAAGLARVGRLTGSLLKEGFVATGDGSTQFPINSLIRGCIDETVIRARIPRVNGGGKL